MTAFEPEAFEALRARLRGPLLLPGVPAYDDGRSLWNAMIDRRPAAIARCLGVADITECVRFARERELRIGIKCGGHNIAGLAMCDGGLVIDLALMRGVWVDTASRLARAQAGCLLGDVDRETQLHGLAAALGFVSNTGIAGLTLGGGFGYLTRRFGWTTDTVRAMELVDADGEVVRASETENADLFWGLRGGGGNFGVVTGLEYELERVGPQIVGGVIAWRASDAPGVLELYRQIVENAPPELTCVAVLRRAPPAPWLPTEVHGEQIVALVVCDSGPVEEGEARVAPIKSHGAPVGDIVQRRPYVTQQSILDATQPKGRRYYWKSEYLSGFDAELLEKAAAHAERMVSAHSAIIVFPIDGAISRLPEDHSAVGNRDARAVLNIAAAWESPADDDANIEWAREGWRDMRGFSTGGVYVNFQTEDEGADRVLAAYGDNYDRLVEVKSRWDPQNFFRTNKNIAPRTT
jgi:FAD/FMN-containing dehydrogenase